MKKYFLSLVAIAAMLFATSCQESLVEPQVGGTTTFTVQLPDGMGTKATIGGYELINRVYVEVYSADGSQLIYKPTSHFDFDAINNTATVTLNLIQDQEYDIVFWAQHGESYNVSDLTAVQMNNLHHNSETGAAFFAKLDNFTPGNDSKVELRRPFAQLNLGTTQGSLSTDAGNYKLKSSTITVSTAAEEFNTLTGVGVDQNLNPTTYTATIDFSQSLTVGVENYTYVSMDYLPIPSGSKILVNIAAVIVIEDANGNTKQISHSFESVPVQENYRTNIVGNLISSTTDFIVEVNDDWAGPDYKYDSGNGKVYVEVGTAEELQNAIKDGVDNITLTENITLDHPLVFGAPAQSPIARASASETPSSFVLDLGGKTITTDLQSEGRHYYAIDNYANLTIVGEGAINARGIQNFGTMTIDGNITITNVDTNGGAAIWNEGNITINGGTFTTNDQAGAGSYGAALNTRPGGKAIVNGGTFIANSQLTYAIINEGETIINNVIVKGRHGAVAGVESSVTEIYGGSFELMENPGVSDHCTYYVSSIYGGQFTLGNNTDSGAQVFYESDIADGYVAVEDNGVWTVSKANVVIGTKGYSSLQAAVDGVKSGETITLLNDLEQEDGVVITDKNITIDLNGKTYTVTEGASTNNRNFKINGSSIVTIKNGTMIAEGELTSGAYGTVRAEGHAVVNLEVVKLYSYRGYGLNVKANTGTKVNIKDSEIYSQYSGGVEAAGGEIELTNVKIEQRGVYSSAAWCSVAIGVNGGGKVTVNSGDYYAAAIETDSNAAQATWVAYVMSSGGTLDIKDGTFTGVVAETASAANACGVICADRAAVVNIKGGTFNSNGAILDMRNNVGTQPNPVATLAGGNFSADPRISGLYSSDLIKVAEGYSVVENNGRWTVSNQ